MDKERRTATRREMLDCKTPFFVYLVRESVLSLLFVEPNKPDRLDEPDRPDRPNRPDEPNPRHAPQNSSEPLLISLQLAANVPRFTADACEQILRTMYDTKDEGLIVFQEIDDTVTSEDQFSKVRAIELWNHSTDLGRLELSLGRFNNAINERDRVENGVAGDKVFDVLKIVSGSQRPTDLRHRAILSFSSSWVRTRPSATS